MCCPVSLSKPVGCRVTDADGRSYIDFNCGNGPNLLGYQHPEVEAAARAQAQHTDLAPFFNPAMVEYAERLIDWSADMDWVVTVKNGSDATNLALRTMRAVRQKPLIVMFVAAYHGFGSEISLAPEFAPEETARNVVRIAWNDAAALDQLASSHGDQIAGIMMNPLDQSPLRETVAAEPAFMEAIERMRAATGALLAIDDVRHGFRLHPAGSHRYLGVEPDLLCLGKAMGNGHAVAALLGTARTRDGVERIQLTATYMFSAVAHRAGIAVLDIYEREATFAHMQAMGQRLVDGLLEAGRAAGHEDLLLSGPVTMPTLLFKQDAKAKRARTFARLAAQGGVIFHPTLNWFLSGAHTAADIDEAIHIGAAAFRDTPRVLD